MTDKRCPKCRLHNPPSAQRCDCGYDFGSGRMEQSYLVDADSSSAPVPWYTKAKNLAVVVVALVLGSILSAALVNGFRAAAGGPSEQDRRLDVSGVRVGTGNAGNTSDVAGAEPDGLQATLDNAAAVASRSLPRRMDNGISFDRVRSPGMKTLVYEYSFPDQVAAQIDAKTLRTQTYQGSLSALCDNPGQKDWFNRGVTTVYVYRDRVGTEVFRVEFTKKDCDQRYSW